MPGKEVFDGGEAAGGEVSLIGVEVELRGEKMTCIRKIVFDGVGAVALEIRFVAI